MCYRCDAVDATGKALPPTVEFECSWCDETYMVCWWAAGLIKNKQMAGLCRSDMGIVNAVRIGDFGTTRRNAGHDDEERDVDANGWLSNAIRLLEDPVER